MNAIVSASIFAGTFALSATAIAAPLAPSSTGLNCDSSIAAAFRPNSQTRVLLVKAFKKGDLLPNPPGMGQHEGSPYVVRADLCLIKLVVGTGNPGPNGAPSTSVGIGIEVWLPGKQAWNGRLHALGGGGWAGTEETDPTKISSVSGASDARSAATVAADEGAIASTTDTGHAGMTTGGAFLMNPDGTINGKLWGDFAERAIHEQIVASKALAMAYYGSAPRFTYWDGGSTGGRQALKQAQRYPADFDGIISAFPAINWSRFITSELDPQIVIQRDLDGKHMSPAQLNFVSNAAIAACDVIDGKHLGFILHPEECRYDPTKDREVLCASDGGKNETAACVTLQQAQAINKIWYGMTSDGSVPDPAIDNGSGPLKGKRKWFGLSRGTSLLLAGNTPLGIAADMIALEMQDARLATSTFKNAKANGADRWKALSYEELSRAFDAGVSLQSKFGFINSDDPDLTAFWARGGKLIHFHGSNDELIPYQGSVNYYERVLARMGGISKVSQFYRFYVVAGLGHMLANGTANPLANPPFPRPPQGQVYLLLTDWVEKGVAPENAVIESASADPITKSLPLCAYPTRPIYVAGDIFQANSYTCR